MADLDMKQILEEVRANLKKLRECPRHLFENPAEKKLGMKLTCQNCGGVMDFVDIGHYIAGYKAAGKSPDDIMPNFEGKNDGNVKG